MAHVIDTPTLEQIQRLSSNAFWKLEWWNCANQRWEMVTADFLFPDRNKVAISTPQPGVRLTEPKVVQVQWHTADSFWDVNGRKITAVGKEEASGIWYAVVPNPSRHERIFIDRGKTTIDVICPR